jgi:hypothetical protein
LPEGELLNSSSVTHEVLIRGIINRKNNTK